MRGSCYMMDPPTVRARLGDLRGRSQLRTTGRSRIADVRATWNHCWGRAVMTGLSRRTFPGQLAGQFRGCNVLG
jgi:hypothetical protein